MVRAVVEVAVHHRLGQLFGQEDVAVAVAHERNERI
jgi:hypothetical protein